MKSGSGLSNGSSRVSRRTAQHKQPSVQASPEWVQEGARHLLLLHTWELSSQPNRASRV